MTTFGNTIFYFICCSCWRYRWFFCCFFWNCLRSPVYIFPINWMQWRCFLCVCWLFSVTWRLSVGFGITATLSLFTSIIFYFWKLSISVAQTATSHSYLMHMWNWIYIRNQQWFIQLRFDLNLALVYFHLVWFDSVRCVCAVFLLTLEYKF